MLTAQILSALTVSVCLLIDNAVIGKFIGVNGIAAYGLANPILLTIGGISTVLASGVQVSCSKSLGKGDVEEINRGFSSAVGIAGLFSAAFLLVVLSLNRALPTLLGAGRQGVLYDNTRAYLVGFCLGAPGCMGSLILVPFLQMAGKSGLLIAAVLGMTVSDVVFDILAVTVFKSGMFGIGLASSLSYYTALIIGFGYFFSKKSRFKFVFREISISKVGEFFKSGIPAVFNMASYVILVFFLNKILLSIEGSAAVAAFTIITTLGNTGNCISTGINGVSLTLSGVLYQEEDKTGLKNIFTYLYGKSLLLGACVGTFVALLSPYLVAFFMPEKGAAQSMAIYGLRLYVLGFIPCCLNYNLKGMYLGTGRVIETDIYSVAEGLVFPLLAALIFSGISGVQGVWYFFAVGEVLTLAGAFVYVRIKSGKRIPDAVDFLLLDKKFGVRDRDLLEWNIRNIKQVSDVSEEAGKFCLERGADSRIAFHVALCIEEVAANVIEHGFGKIKKVQNHLSVRLMNKDKRWVLRFRDDCFAFDPLSYIPNDPGPSDSVSGIKLLLGISDNAKYTNTLNMNNFMLVIDKK